MNNGRCGCLENARQEMDKATEYQSLQRVAYMYVELTRNYEA